MLYDFGTGAWGFWDAKGGALFDANWQWQREDDHSYFCAGKKSADFQVLAKSLVDFCNSILVIGVGKSTMPAWLPLCFVR